PSISEYINHLEDPTLPRKDDVAEYLKPFSLKENLVLREGLVYVPDNNEIKLSILRQYHDLTTAGHLGQAKTLELITRKYSVRSRNSVHLSLRLEVLQALRY